MIWQSYGILTDIVGFDVDGSVNHVIENGDMGLHWQHLILGD